MNWQPIATAPKDESVLIYRKSGRICIARFDHQKHHTKPRPFWNDYGLHDKTSMRFDEPSHWMPLPTPPTADPSRLPGAQ